MRISAALAFVGLFVGCPHVQHVRDLRTAESVVWESIPGWGATVQTGPGFPAEQVAEILARESALWGDTRVSDAYRRLRITWHDAPLEVRADGSKVSGVTLNHDIGVFNFRSVDGRPACRTALPHELRHVAMQAVYRDADGAHMRGEWSWPEC